MKRLSIKTCLVALIVVVCAYKGMLYSAASLFHERNFLYLSRVIECRNTQNLYEDNYFEILKKNIWAVRDNTRQQLVCDGFLLLIIIVFRCINPVTSKREVGNGDS